MAISDKYKALETRYTNGVGFNRCGKSGLMLPKLSLGMWHNFGDVDDLYQALNMFKESFDNGITHFDLANNYGTPFGSAEINFGKMYKANFESYRDEMIISTKAGHLMWNGPYGDGGSRKYIMASIDQSLKRMQLDYVDIFYSHRYDPNTPLEETMGALSDIVKQGKALYVGISKYPLDKTIEAFKLLKENGTPGVIYQGVYNIFSKDLEKEILPYLAENGIGFIAFSPLAQGMLSDKYINGIPSNSRAALSHGFLQTSQITPEKLEKIQKLNEIAQERGQSLAQMALAWCSHNQHINSLIIGTSSRKQLLNNIDALKNTAFTDNELWKIGELG